MDKFYQIITEFIMALDLSSKFHFAQYNSLRGIMLACSALIFQYLENEGTESYQILYTHYH